MATPSSLSEVRSALLALHKALLDADRVVYEAVAGPIRSPNHFLQLLTGDPWFAWLRGLSQHIVMIDEAMEAKPPMTLTAEAEAALIEQSRTLVAALEKGEGVTGRSVAPVWMSASVVPVHERVRALLKR